MNPFIFQEGNTSNFEKAIAVEMDKAIKYFEKELSTIRTGRASSKLVEDLKVESYGQQMKLKTLANIATPEARLITIQPWDKNNLHAIEKALLSSGLEINPVNDGKIIRIPLPQMTEDRRMELDKFLGKKTEECRIAIRNVRKDFQNRLRDSVKNKQTSEDFAKRLSELLQKITDKFIDIADADHDKKSKEIKFI